jgi:hypothetical protein
MSYENAKFVSTSMKAREEVHGGRRLKSDKREAWMWRRKL